MQTNDDTIANRYAPPKAEVADPVADAKRDGEPYMQPCSLLKLFVFSAATFNIYLLYWFWKNFRHEQRRNPEIWPVLRTIFSGIFFYTLARSALDEADTRGIPAKYSPGLLTALLWAAAIGSRFLPDSWAVIVFLYSVILMPVQRVVNRINRDINPALQQAERFRGLEIALCVPGGLLLLLGIIGALFLPEV